MRRTASVQRRKPLPYEIAGSHAPPDPQQVLRWGGLGWDGLVLLLAASNQLPHDGVRGFLVAYGALVVMLDGADAADDVLLV